MDHDLVGEADLTGYPGAPFSKALVSEAADAIRTQAGWHIAPEVQETVEVYTGGARLAVLPSLRIKSVSEVRDAVSGRVIDGWRLRKDACVLTSASSFPDSIEVDMVHGHEKCPPAVVGLVVSRVQDGKRGRIRREALAGRSVDYETSTGAELPDPVLSKHTLPPRP